MRNHALGSLEWMVTSLGQFEKEWIELTKADLPSCWEPGIAMFQPLQVYELKMIEVMN